MKSNKATFGVKFVVVGTRQLMTSVVSANSKNDVANFIIEKYGYCSYLVINQI